MAPGLQNRDGVFAAPHSATDALKVGDVVVARHPFVQDVVIIKRIEAIDKGRFQLLGDNPNESTDSRSLGWFGPEAILGRAVARYPAPVG